MRRTLIVLLATLALASCGPHEGNRQLGRVLGGIAGAVLGSQISSGAGQIAATIGLGALGAWLGEELSKEDHLIIDSTTNTALNTNHPGQASTWNNPKSGASGTITPGPYYTAKFDDQKALKKTCRKIKVVVSSAGKPEKRGQRTACRTTNGEWRIIDA